MKSPSILATMALACACASFTVAAQQREAMKACAADVKTLCANVERGDGRIAQCLRDNQDKVSAACKTQLQSMAGRAKGSRGPAPAASAASGG
jgi:hypothetical protein